MCKTQDWLNLPREFDLCKFPPEVFGMLFRWSPCHVQVHCSWKGLQLFSWRQVGCSLQKISFVRIVGAVVFKLIEC